MPFQIVRNDITNMQVDAIVNAANETLLGGGGVDGAIHRAAGPELLAECRTLGGCKPGQAKITGAYRLPCRYVIHTVGPIWHGGQQGEAETLRSCYRSALQLAEAHGCESIAFPLISAGAYGYPGGQAMQIATDTIRDFLLQHEMQVYLVVFDRSSFALSQRLYANIQAFIDDAYVGPEFSAAERARRVCGNRPSFAPPEQSLMQTASPRPAAPRQDTKPIPALQDSEREHAKSEASGIGKAASFFRRRKARQETLNEELLTDAAIQQGPAESLDDYLASLDESFRDMLIRKIDESGMTDAECYKRANIDRKLFNKIKNQSDYRPGKSTVLAFAVALRLPLPETEDMLKKAGFSLSHSSKFDLIVEYFIRHSNYDIFEINEALFSFDQKLLGSAL